MAFFTFTVKLRDLHPCSTAPLTWGIVPSRIRQRSVYSAMTDAASEPGRWTFGRSNIPAHRLVVDGIVGPVTWSWVLITVRPGNVGPGAVKAVQDQANFRNPRRAAGRRGDRVLGPACPSQMPLAVDARRQ